MLEWICVTALVTVLVGLYLKLGFVDIYGPVLAGLAAASLIMSVFVLSGRMVKAQAWIPLVLLIMFCGLTAGKLANHVSVAGFAAQINSPKLIEGLRYAVGTDALSIPIKKNLNNKSFKINAADVACSLGHEEALTTLIKYNVTPSSNYCFNDLLAHYALKPNSIMYGKRLELMYPKYISDHIENDDYPMPAPAVYIASTCPFSKSGITELFAKHAQSMNQVFKDFEGNQGTALDVAIKHDCSENIEILEKFGAITSKPPVAL